MRDILSDLQAEDLLSDPDPVKRAQLLSKPTMPKRFYKEVTTAIGDEGTTILLDGRPVRTPSRSLIALRNGDLAQQLAEEFSTQADYINLATMPLYRLLNSALDGVATDVSAVIEDITRFASSDMVCYRVDGPARLVDIQNEKWTPVLDWAERELGASFNLCEGVMPIAQPEQSLQAVQAHLAKDNDPLRIAALHIMTSISGSALIPLAREAKALSFDEAWAASHVDEDWTIEHWGEDSEAIARREFRRRDMLAADNLLFLR